MFLGVKSPALWACLVVVGFLSAANWVHAVERGEQSRLFTGSGDKHAQDDGLKIYELHQRERLRTYSLYTPSSYKGDHPVPLVVAFHGGHGRGAWMAQRVGLSEIAEREGFIVSYPDAAGDRHWNDGRPTTSTNVDDVSFVAALIDRIKEIRNIEPRRIYAIGLSNGGSFTARLACELSDRLAAFAQVASTMSIELKAICKPKKPVPIMIVNGTSDPLVPWKGGELRQTQRLGKGGKVIAAAETVRFWATANGCSGEPAVDKLPDRDPYDETRVERTHYKNCRDETEVVLLAIEGGGHTWPGSAERPGLKRVVGRTSRDINASELIWDFFRKHSLRRKS